MLIAGGGDGPGSPHLGGGVNTNPDFGLFGAAK